MAVSRGFGLFLARRLSESSSRLGYMPRLRCLEFLSHDLWLDEQPSGFHHDPDSVPVCPYMFRMGCDWGQGDDSVRGLPWRGPRERLPAPLVLARRLHAFVGRNGLPIPVGVGLWLQGACVRR